MENGPCRVASGLSFFASSVVRMIGGGGGKGKIGSSPAILEEGGYAICTNRNFEPGEVRSFLKLTRRARVFVSDVCIEKSHSDRLKQRRLSAHAEEDHLFWEGA